MKKVSLKLTAILMLMVSTLFVNAQDQANRINVVTTAVPFLRISPDARAGGMGDVGIATLPDANAIFWNLSKIPFSKNKSEIGLTYTPWLKGLDLNDVYLVSAAGYHQLDELQAISGSLRYFSLGNIQFTDNMGNDLEQYRPREFAIDAGYSRKLSERLGLGIALRYINSNLASGQSQSGSTYKAGTAVAGDQEFANGQCLPGGRHGEEARAGAGPVDELGLRSLMYFTDRGIEELADRRGEEQVTLEWVGDQLRTFVDLHPEFETPIDRLASWLARLDDDELDDE